MIKKIKSKIFQIVTKLFHNKQKESFGNTSNKLDDAIEKDNTKECNEYVRKLFNQIHPGDIVYAHMPLPEEELEKIPEGHRTRPYYIADKQDDGFIAYSLSSSPYEYVPDTKTYSLSEIVYSGLAKSSYLDLYNPYYLPKDKIIRFICTTKKNDYNEMQRRLWIGNEKEYGDNDKEKSTLYKPMPGDIVNYNKGQWLIIGEDNNNYSALEISYINKKNFNHGVNVHCNLDVWRVNFSKGIVIPKNNALNTQHIVNKDEFINLKSQIELNKKKHKKNKQKSNKPKKYFTKFNIGTVFKDLEDNEEYIYLYSNKSYDYCIKVSEYLNDDVYPEYSMYETLTRELIRNGEITDDELKEILLDQISYGNDRCNILENKIKNLDN